MRATVMVGKIGPAFITKYDNYEGIEVIGNSSVQFLGGSVIQQQYAAKVDATRFMVRAEREYQLAFILALALAEAARIEDEFGQIMPEWVPEFQPITDMIDVGNAI